MDPSGRTAPDSKRLAPLRSRTVTCSQRVATDTRSAACGRQILDRYLRLQPACVHVDV